jgi:uncharacterized protein (DUF433 family)
MLGKPVIKGTRLTVELLLEKLASYGYSSNAFVCKQGSFLKKGISI